MLVWGVAWGGAEVVDGGERVVIGWLGVKSGMLGKVEV